MAAMINILEKMNPKFVAQNRLQPMSPQFIACGADQVNQVLTETQNVCCIKGRFIIAWRRLFQVSFKERVQKQLSIAERFLGAAADDIGRFDDLVRNDQQDVAGTIIVVPLSFPMYGGKFRLMWPCLRAFDADAQALQSSREFIQVLFRLLDNPLRERAAWNLGQ